MSLEKIIIALALMSMFAYSANSATLSEAQQVATELKQICRENKINCFVGTNLTDTQFNAFSTVDNEIFLTVPLIKYLSKEELKGVGLHEVGHLVYRHPKLLKTINKTAPTKIVIKAFRHSLEFQADEFTTRYYIKHKQHNYLIDALRKIGVDKYEKEAITHPSIRKRIEAMVKLENKDVRK